MKECNAKVMAMALKKQVVPANAITEETYLWRAENAMCLDPEDKRKYVTAVIGPNNHVYEDFQCLICYCFANEPQVC